jgi:hypothetical protein
LVLNVFGPMTESIGEALGRFTDYRLGNVQRIAKVADRKSVKAGRDGIVNPRIARSLLEEGSYCDDELMAEYFGGLLAAGRSPSGRDDRAVAWTSMLASMSALDVRLHFILYREWAYALAGLLERDEDAVSYNQGLAAMYVDLDAVVAALRLEDDDQDEDLSAGQALNLATRAVTGLGRHDLVDRNHWSVGATNKMPDPPPELPFADAILVVPTYPGIELFGWACGMPSFNFRDFISLSEVPEFEGDIARPRVVLPHLRSSEQDTAQPTSDN